MKNSKLIITILFLTLFSNSIFGQRIVWAAAGMTLTPTAKTIEKKNYVTTAGTIKLKPSTTGTMSFIGAVPTLSSGKYKIKAWVRITNARLGVESKKLGISLRRRNLNTGAVETVLAATPGRRGLNGYMSSPSYKYVNFDFSKYTYWIQASYTRKTLNHPEVHINAVQLVRQ